MKSLVSSDAKLEETIAASVEVSLANLLRDINKFSSSTAHLKYNKQNFPLDTLMVTNKSMLDAIASLEESRSRQVM